MNAYIHDTFRRGVGGCLHVCVCPLDNLETIADICFLLSSYVDQTCLPVRVIGQGQRVQEIYDFLLEIAGGEILVIYVKLLPCWFIML